MIWPQSAVSDPKERRKHYNIHPNPHRIRNLEFMASQCYLQALIPFTIDMGRAERCRKALLEQNIVQCGIQKSRDNKHHRQHQNEKKQEPEYIEMI